jgi:predicted transcriptional regulator
MTKTHISIKLESDKLTRIDKLAADEGISRTAVIERMFTTSLEDQEAFNRSLENPMVRELHKRMTSSPSVIKALAKFVRQEISNEEIDSGIEQMETLRESSRKNRIDKKNKRKKSEEKSE